MTITLERAAAVTTTAFTEVVRIHRVPRCEPPYDDELGAPSPGGTALARTGPGRRTPYHFSSDRSDYTPPDHSQPDHGARDNSDAGDTERTTAERVPAEAGGSGRTSPARRRALTPAELAAMRFLKGYGEVLAGFRPVRHLAPIIAPEVYETVAGHLLQPRRGGHLGPTSTGWRTGFVSAQPSSTLRPGTGATGVPVPGRSRPAVTLGPIRLRTYRVCEPLEDVAEVSAVFDRGSETWAVALRLERRNAAWLCTVLLVV